MARARPRSERSRSVCRAAGGSSKRIRSSRDRREGECRLLAGARRNRATIRQARSCGRSLENPWRSTLDDHSTPRGAVTPGNALLNYLYGVLASEVTIALHTFGLDPSLGILHTDKDNRSSLTYDLMEPLRAICVDRWLFDWLWATTFSKRDFREDAQGFIRCTHPLIAHLGMTAALWRRIVESIVQWFYKRLSGDNSRLRLDADNMLVDKI